MTSHVENGRVVTAGDTPPATRGDLGSLWVFLLSAGLAVAVLVRLRVTVDPDLWLHLRIGDALRGGERFQELPDPLVTLADKPYVPTQWLGELIFTAAHNAAGVAGVHVLRVLALSCLIALVYASARVYGSAGQAGCATLVAIPATATAWGERPQLLGLVLFAATVWLWVRARRNGTVPWAIVPVSWVWSMIHGSWILGLAAGGVFLVCMVVERPRRSRPWLQLVGAIIAATGAVALTPLGPHLLLEPLLVGRAASDSVNEWQPPAPDNPLFILVVVMAVTVGLRCLGQVRRRLPELLVAAAGVALAASAVRTVAFGAILVAPAFATAIGRRDSARVPWTRREAWPLFVVGGLLLITPGVVLGAPQGGPLSKNVDNAVRSLPENSIAAVEPYSSGWVLWAHPQIRVLRDLRSEVYSTRVAREYESFSRADPGWQRYAQREHVSTMILADGSPLDRALASEPGWEVRVRESGHVVWHQQP